MIEALLELGDAGRLLDLLRPRGRRGLVPTGLVEPVAAIPGGRCSAPGAHLGWYAVRDGKRWRETGDMQLTARTGWRRAPGCISPWPSRR